MQNTYDRCVPRSTATRAAASSEVSEVFLALGAVVKRLRHRPLPADDSLRTALQGMAPAPRHIRALVQLAEEGPLGMSELAERMDVSAVTASLLVSDLADRGLVLRSTDPDDRRRTTVTIADEHRPAVRALLRSRLQPLEHTMQRLAPAERTAFLHALRLLADELDNTEETCDH